MAGLRCVGGEQGEHALNAKRCWALMSVIGVAITLCTRTHGRPPTAITEPRVEYTVRLPAPQTQMVEMTAVFRGLSGDSLEVCLPVWRPGRYAILDASGTVRDVRARSGDGAVLTVEKANKATWHVATGGSTEVVVDYRVYANSLADRTRHVDDTHAFLSPSCVFMYAPSLRAEPLTVHIDAPDSWRVASGLECEPGQERTLHAANYDVLVDSPIEIGLHERSTFDVEGTPHEIVVWWGGKSGAEPAATRPKFLDLERLNADFARIVRAQRDVFGELPYRRYVYILHACVGASGGTEHLNSTVMQASPARFHTESGYRGVLTLVAHEMFHTWNIKQLRPAALKPYDYQRENYTDLLWMAEGTTTYYEHVTLTRAGLMKPDDLLKELGKSIDSLRRRPGAAVQSVEESSVDAWVKFNRANPDAPNATVSFYESGALVSLALDLEIRRASGDQASLDDLMRDLYSRFPLAGPGYSRQDVIDSAVRLGFENAPSFFTRHVRGTEPPDFEGLLSVLGLELTRSPARKPAGSGEESPDPADGPYLGITTEVREGHTIVTGVLSDGPAYQAGIMPGDVVVALDGERVRAGEWPAMAARLVASRPAALSYFRMDVLSERTVVPTAQPSGTWKVTRVKSPTPQQRAAYERWSGEPWPDVGSKENSPDPQAGTPAVE